MIGGLATALAIFGLVMLFDPPGREYEPPGIPAEGVPRAEEIDCGKHRVLIEFRKTPRNDLVDDPSAVREVYEALRDDLPIVQNTVQAFLRTMESKELVTHESAN